MRFWHYTRKVASCALDSTFNVHDAVYNVFAGVADNDLGPNEGSVNVLIYFDR